MTERRHAVLLVSRWVDDVGMTSDCDKESYCITYLMKARKVSKLNFDEVGRPSIFTLESMTRSDQSENILLCSTKMKFSTSEIFLFSCLNLISSTSTWTTGFRLHMDWFGFIDWMKYFRPWKPILRNFLLPEDIASRRIYTICYISSLLVRFFMSIIVMSLQNNSRFIARTDIRLVWLGTF